MAKLTATLTTATIGESSRSEAINYLSLVLVLVEKGIVSEKEINAAREHAKQLIDEELKTGAVDLRKYYEQRLTEYKRLFKKTDDKLNSAISAHKRMNRNKGKTSRFHGVDFYAKTQRWRARIKVIGETNQRHLGEYDDELQAAEAYNIAAKLAYGKLAQLNDLSDIPKRNRNRKTSSTR
jgi:ribosomal protein L16/L10AE